MRLAASAAYSLFQASLTQAKWRLFGNEFAHIMERNSVRAADLHCEGPEIIWHPI